VVAFALDDPVYCLKINALGRVKIHALIAIAGRRAMLHFKPRLSEEPLDILFKLEPIRSARGQRLVKLVDTLQSRPTAENDRASGLLAAFVGPHEGVSFGNAASVMFSQKKLRV
jgi:hypothetical protein